MTTPLASCQECGSASNDTKPPDERFKRLAAAMLAAEASLPPQPLRHCPKACAFVVQPLGRLLQLDTSGRKR